MFHCYPVRPLLIPMFADRLDDAAVAIQKEKNMYKEIENYPMCFKVGGPGLSHFTNTCCL